MARRFLNLDVELILEWLRKLADELEIIPNEPKLSFILWFKEGELVMGEITVKDSDAPFSGTVSFLDAKGNVTSPDDVPKWTSSDTNVATVEVSDDGLTATVTPGNPGAAIVEVISVEDSGDEIVAQGTVTVQPGDAVIGNVEFSTSPST